MLRSYLLVALRHLRRHAGYAAVNVLGLGLGIACALLAVLYLQHEYGFDAYHEEADRLYRLVSYGGLGEKEWGGYVAGDPVPEMRTGFADVEDATKLMRCGPDRLVLDGEVHGDVAVLCGESNLFGMFSFELVRGDPETVLDRADTAVITQSLARRLFGKRDPIGEALPVRLWEEERSFVITGLMEDVPANTHFAFDLLLSYESLRSTPLCLTCGQPMYALLREDADPVAVAERVLRLVRETQGQEYVEEIALEPVRSIHFSEIPAERQSDERYAHLLAAVAILILVIACANYTNLATALSFGRMREVGVRKAMGANRSQLLRQFVVETVVLAGLALPLALALLVLALPSFNALAETAVRVQGREVAYVLGAAAGLVGVVGLLAGGYPALLLSGLQPVEVFRGRLPSGLSGAALRRALVVFQFAASIVLIIGTAVVLRQLSFMQEKELGFDAEQVVVVRVTDPELARKPDVLKRAFRAQPGVMSVTAGAGMPGQHPFHGRQFIVRPRGEDGPAVSLAQPTIDEDFLSALDVPLLTGRNIGAARPEGEVVEALVNESAVRTMGWGSPEDALGREVGGSVVVGVVPDFHFESLHRPIAPLLMVQDEYGWAGTVAVRVAGGETPQTLARLEQAWEATGTPMPFEFRFLTDELDLLYEGERRTARAFGVFAALAVLIGCLGLFGLAAYAAARRTKEVGIRKVLGASVPHLVGLLTRELVGLVAVAFVLAVPVSYVAVERWLEGFAYRSEPSVVPFVLAGVVALAVAVASTSVQAVRAALADPVVSIRHE